MTSYAQVANFIECAGGKRGIRGFQTPKNPTSKKLKSKNYQNPVVCEIPRNQRGPKRGLSFPEAKNTDGGLSLEMQEIGARAAALTQTPRASTSGSISMYTPETRGSSTAFRDDGINDEFSYTGLPKDKLDNYRLHLKQVVGTPLLSDNMHGLLFYIDTGKILDFTLEELLSIVDNKKPIEASDATIYALGIEDNTVKLNPEQVNIISHAVNRHDSREYTNELEQLIRSIGFKYKILTPFGDYSDSKSE